MNRGSAPLHTAVGNNPDSMFSANEPFSSAVTRGRDAMPRLPELPVARLQEDGKRGDKKKKKKDKKKKKEYTSSSSPSQKKRGSKLYRSGSRAREGGSEGAVAPLRLMALPISDQECEPSVHSSSTDTIPDDLQDHSELLMSATMRSMRPSLFTGSMRSTATQVSIDVAQTQSQSSTPRGLTDSIYSVGTQDSGPFDLKCRSTSVPRGLMSESVNFTATQDYISANQRRKEGVAYRDFTEPVKFASTRDSALVQRERTSRSTPQGSRESMLSNTTQDSLVVEQQRRDRAAARGLTESVDSCATQDSLVMEMQQRRTRSVPRGLTESMRSNATQDSIVVAKQRRGGLIADRSVPRGLTDSVSSTESNDSIPSEIRHRASSLPRGLTESLHSAATQDSLLVEKRRRGQLVAQRSIPRGLISSINSLGTQNSIPWEIQHGAQSEPPGLTESMHSTATQDFLLVEKWRRGVLDAQRSIPRGLTNSIHSTGSQESVSSEIQHRARSVPRGLTESMHSIATQDSIVVEKRRRYRFASHDYTEPINFTPTEESIPSAKKRSQMQASSTGLTESMHSAATQDSILLEKKRRGRSELCGLEEESRQSNASKDSVVLERKMRSKSPRPMEQSKSFGSFRRNENHFSINSMSASEVVSKIDSVDKWPQSEMMDNNKEDELSSSPKPPKRMSKAAKSRSLTRILGDASSSDDSIGRNQEERHACSRSPRQAKKKYHLPSRSRKPSLHVHSKSRSVPYQLSYTDDVSGPDDERHALSRSPRQAKKKSNSPSRSCKPSLRMHSKSQSVPHQLSCTNDDSGSDDDSLAEIKAFFHEVKEAHTESTRASWQASERRKEGYQLSSPKQSKRTSGAQSLTKTQPTVSLAVASSDDSTLDDLKDMLLRHPVPDFRRPRTVSLGKKESRSNSCGPERSVILGWQELARRSHENSPKTFDSTSSTPPMKSKSALAVGGLPLAPLYSPATDKPSLAHFFQMNQSLNRQAGTKDRSSLSLPGNSMAGQQTVQLSNQTSPKSVSPSPSTPPVVVKSAVSAANLSPLYNEYTQPLFVEEDEVDAPTLAQYFDTKQGSGTSSTEKNMSTTPVPSSGVIEGVSVSKSVMNPLLLSPHTKPTSPMISGEATEVRPLYTDYVGSLSAEPEQPSLAQYLKMNEDESSNDDVSMSAHDLLMLLDESSEIDFLGHTSDEDSRELEVSHAPDMLMNPKELLAFLEASNKGDEPEKRLVRRTVSKKIEAKHLMTLAEMADVLNHVATRHGNNDDMRWDVIARMGSRGAAPDEADPLRPCDYVGGDDDEMESDMSLLSIEGIDETTDFWNSGGSLRWHPEGFFSDEQ